MKIALAQLDVKAGRSSINVVHMIEMINEARSNDVDVIAFPEMAVGGYLVGDKWTDENYVNDLLEYNEILIQASKNIIVIYGNVYVGKGKGNDGRRKKFNSAYICENQKLIGVTHKILLPNYRIFDDERYFSSPDERPLFANSWNTSIDVHIGVELCEDMWWESYSYNPTKALMRGNSDFIINISASPWTYGKNVARDNVISRMHDSLINFKPFYYVNACGVQNTGKNIITFDGDSRAYNKFGEKLNAQLEPYEEGILYFEDHSNLGTPKKISYTSTKIEEKYNAIIRAYQGIDEMIDAKPTYIFGLSGGIDSALSCTLAVIALGMNRVKGFNLPSKYNSEATKNAAEKLADNLHIQYRVLPITDLIEANNDVFMNLRGAKFTSLAQENIQAKIRGTSILSNLAGLYNGVITNNGNKLETALGYCTLYADTDGIFAPLGDLTKVEVFEMSKFINERYNNAIPLELLPINDLYDFDGIAPSAELKEAQLDPMKFGYHDVMLEMTMAYAKKGIEDFAQWYLDDQICIKMGITKELFLKYKLNEPEIFLDDLEWFFRKIQQSVFKRVQTPPIVLLSQTAYGNDLRESQFSFSLSRRYTRIREKILQIVD